MSGPPAPEGEHAATFYLLLIVANVLVVLGAAVAALWPRPVREESTPYDAAVPVES
ncbi:hypothetical protein ARHIZOSPH14_25170 [Agromyces rhizosphaerae]|uniref:Uncharacterized protein n=1 Tax=Agromyces rhizosphaerae TaxID=88374 RepID=A0A9W6FQ90_9MICO|nr:hypothetical protein [Agromyces rhizosphaerae]GLI28275.1 hypothetical protein ARHIZOSPH14_25170 [Agromyces rhizosphaerae]